MTRQTIVTPEMVDWSVEVSNLALASHDLIVEITKTEEPISLASSAMARLPEWNIIVRRPTPQERRDGIRIVTKIDA